MLKTRLISAAFVAAAVTVPAYAAAQQQAIVVGQTPKGNVLPEGTEIPLHTLTELSSKSNRVGDRFDLEVSDDVTLNGNVVIPMGTKAVGEVTKVIKKGMFGKSGKMETRLLYVKVGGQQVRIRGAVGDRGKGGTAATVGAMVFVPVAGFFVTGTSALLPPRSTAVGLLEADLPVVFSAPAQPQALVVPASKRE